MYFGVQKTGIGNESMRNGKLEGGNVCAALATVKSLKTVRHRSDYTHTDTLLDTLLDTLGCIVLLQKPSQSPTK